MNKFKPGDYVRVRNKPRSIFEEGIVRTIDNNRIKNYEIILSKHHGWFWMNEDNLKLITIPKYLKK